MRFFVYKLTFANYKVYIGMSRTDRHGHSVSRYAEHDYSARSGVDLPIYRAWRKHGSPKEEIIGFYESKQQCAQAEIDAILKYRATDPSAGYNVTSGGDGLHVEKGSEAYLKIGSKTWNNLKWRSEMSQRHKGRADVRSPEGKERHRLAAIKSATPERMRAMRGKAFSNPENVRKFEEGRATWRNSARNAEHCKHMAKRAAEACQRSVRDPETGIQYPSQRAMAQALGLNEASVSRKVSLGIYERV